jgi:valyl-tRNA synthetase
MNIPTKYNPAEVEDKWYEYWMKNDYFHSEPDEREPYTIVIPPPNVTGVLHMGHMLNNTLQDVLTRRMRMKGYNACWVPGTDHASIATEAKVVAKLKSEGISKDQLTREEFLEHAWDWTHKHGGIILEQLKKLGASCDWKRTKFTLDDDLYESVIKVFIDLYNKGKIYRGYRMVNWDPEAKTTLSDEEVIYNDEQGHLYYINYPIAGREDEYIQIATTRPETILGDTAIAVSPQNEKYKKYIGQKAIVPISGREIPIIADDYVDPEFGTGALKITPAHDPNDKEIGERHNLEVINIFNEDATLNEYGLHYQGKDRDVVKKEIVEELKEKGFIEKIEPHMHRVGRSERTNAVIEPRISRQWFLKMKELAEPAIKAVRNEEVKIIPKKFENTYFHWMENVRDWNISRQLWWGHRIPAYYYGEGENDFVVAENIEKALELARKKTGNSSLQLTDLKQDEDALDTWFSSWLWPMSVFDGIRNPDNPDFKYYYPTNDLVTAPEILFFWVARMIMAGYEFAGEKPFENVYLTGIVRDKLGRKMSKSLGNSPDPIKMMKEYGADAVRVGMLLTSPAGNDLPFDMELVLQGRNFANKIWNGFRLLKTWEIDEKKIQPDYAKTAVKWFNNKFQKTLNEIEEDFSKYRISNALMKIYKLIWDDYSSWFLEMVKPGYGEKMDPKTYNEIIEILENNLKVLHPFMPFITEEIWQYIKERTPQEAIIIAKYPEKKDFDEDFINEMEQVQEVISNIRKIRTEKQIPQKESLKLQRVIKQPLSEEWDDIIIKLANVSEIENLEQAPIDTTSFRVKFNEYFVPLEGLIDEEAEKQKMEEELKYLEGFLQSVRKKLSNERFVNNAPAQVVEKEKQKEADAIEKIKLLQSRLNK